MTDILTHLVEGTVTLDGTAAVRGSCDLTFVDPTGELIPTAVDDPLAPYGNEIALERGAQLADGRELTAALGVYRIQDTEVSDGPDGVTIKVSGYDRSRRIQDAKFEDVGDPMQIAGGTNYWTALLGVVQGGWPGVSYSFDPPTTTLTTPTLTYEEGGDRWAFAQDMAAAVGMDLFFDGEGVLVLQPIPSIQSGTPVATLAEGEQGLLLRADSTWTREGAFNKVIYTGENTGTTGDPPRGVALDNNPGYFRIAITVGIAAPGGSIEWNYQVVWG